MNMIDMIRWSSSSKEKSFILQLCLTTSRVVIANNNAKKWVSSMTSHWLAIVLANNLIPGICVTSADFLRPLFAQIFRFTHDDAIKWKHFLRHGPIVGEFTGHRWIPLTKASGAEL